MKQFFLLVHNNVKRYPLNVGINLLNSSDRLGNCAVTLATGSVDAIAVDSRSPSRSATLLALIVAVFEVESVDVAGDIAVTNELAVISTFYTCVANAQKQLGATKCAHTQGTIEG